MNYLLDTQALKWVLGDPARISPATRERLADDDSTVHVSVISLWEIAVKCRIGKLRANLSEIVEQLAPSSKIGLLPLSVAHLTALTALAVHAQHRDPFDHLLIAQAIAEDMMFVSADGRAALYDVKLLRI